MPSKKYLPRVVDAQLSRALSMIGAVVITGPRACGKTQTGLQHANSSISLDESGPAAELIAMDSRAALPGATPRLIDEWQVVPEVWNQVRHEVDRRQQNAQFILTGSAWPEESARRHSGAGRMLVVKMRPMSLWESGDSTGEVSLAGLFSEDTMVGATSSISVRGYAELITAGGWPGFLRGPRANAYELVRGYLETVIQRDFPVMGGSRRDPRRLDHFLRAYAQLTAHSAPLSNVQRRVAQDGNIDPGKDFPAVFHDFASRLMLIEDLPAWSPSVRSRTPLIEMPKRHFVDPSLAAASLRLTPERLLNDLETLGYFFESLVVRDVRVYAEGNGFSVAHFRDKGGVSEIDVVVEDPEGNWVGLEVKLSHREVEKAATSLKRAAAKVTRPPKALVIIIPTGVSLRRADGVWVIPLATLAP